MSCKDIKKECYYTEEFRFNEMIGVKPGDFDWQKLINDDIIPAGSYIKYMNSHHITVQMFKVIPLKLKDMLIKHKEKFDWDSKEFYKRLDVQFLNDDNVYSLMNKDVLYKTLKDQSNIKWSLINAERILEFYNVGVIDMERFMNEIMYNILQNNVKDDKDRLVQIVKDNSREFFELVKSYEDNYFPNFSTVFKFIHQYMKDDIAYIDADRCEITFGEYINNSPKFIREGLTLNMKYYQGYHWDGFEYFNDDVIEERFKIYRKQGWNIFNPEFYKYRRNVLEYIAKCKKKEQEDKNWKKSNG